MTEETQTTPEVAEADAYAPLKELYFKLVDKRKKLDDDVQSLQKKLDEINAVIEGRREQANAIALQMSEARGGQSYIDLCKQISSLAKSLSGQLKS